MKIFINIIRVLVGILFIFSGLVKANDPMGLSYKMQEFFDLWHMSQLNDYTLWFSILIIAFEIIAGIALLLGWNMKLFGWLLLLLIIFFTFLTGYAFLSGKFKNCGCFGDCIPITPLTSFIKDLVLLAFILLLFGARNKIKTFLPEKINLVLLLLAIIGSFWIQFHALRHLPYVDCLPYKVGNNITEKRQPPLGAKPDVYDTKMIYHKDGKKFEFSPADLPADWQTYTYDTTISKLVKKGNMEPEIKGFYLSGSSDIDSTDIVLSQPYAVLLFAEDFSKTVGKWKNEFEKIHEEASKKNIPVYIVSTIIDEAKKAIASTSFADLQVFKCDFTAIRTAARANPTLYILKNGTIIGKWSYANLSNANNEIIKIPKQEIQIPESPVQLPDSIIVQDSTSD